MLFRQLTRGCEYLVVPNALPTMAVAVLRYHAWILGPSGFCPNNSDYSVRALVDTRSLIGESTAFDELGS